MSNILGSLLKAHKGHIKGHKKLFWFFGGHVNFTTRIRAATAEIEKKEKSSVPRKDGFMGDAQ